MKQDSPFAKTIKYSAAISCLLCIIFTALFHIIHSDVLLSLAITMGTIGYHFIMRLAVGWIIPALVKKNMNPDARWFQSRPFEKKLYRFLKVRRWKGKMPTYNPSDFSFEENTPEQIIINSCVSELVHEVIAVASLLPIFAWLIWGVLPVFLTTSIISAGVDCCFVIMQRYNRPRLQNYCRRKSVDSIQKRGA